MTQIYENPEKKKKKEEIINIEKDLINKYWGSDQALVLSRRKVNLEDMYAHVVSNNEDEDIKVFTNALRKYLGYNYNHMHAFSFLSANDRAYNYLKSLVSKRVTLIKISSNIAMSWENFLFNIKSLLDYMLFPLGEFEYCRWINSYRENQYEVLLCCEFETEPSIFDIKHIVESFWKDAKTIVSKKYVSDVMSLIRKSKRANLNDDDLMRTWYPANAKIFAHSKNFCKSNVNNEKKGLN